MNITRVDFCPLSCRQLELITESSRHWLTKVDLWVWGLRLSQHLLLLLAIHITSTLRLSWWLSSPQRAWLLAIWRVQTWCGFPSLVLIIHHLVWNQHYAAGRPPIGTTWLFMACTPIWAPSSLGYRALPSTDKPRAFESHYLASPSLICFKRLWLNSISTPFCMSTSLIRGAVLSVGLCGKSRPSRSSDHRSNNWVFMTSCSSPTCGVLSWSILFSTPLFIVSSDYCRHKR